MVKVGAAAVVRRLMLSNGSSQAASLAVSTSGSGYTVSHQLRQQPGSVGAECSIDVSLVAGYAGTLSGNLHIRAGSQTLDAALTAVGSNSAVPVLQWTPAMHAMSFGANAVGSDSNTQVVTLRNAGPGATTVRSLTLSGEQAAAFALDPSGTCAQGRSHWPRARAARSG